MGDRQRLFERLQGVLGQRLLTNDGPLVQEFEQSIAHITGARNAIAVSNATVGLEIVARALGLTGEVIVPSFTFVAIAHALSWMRIRPVFCDIDPDTLTLDPETVERLIGPSTSAILGVHLWGRTCDVEGLERVSSEHGIPVIYDAAHAFACTHRGRPVGTFGSAEVFSFHATKFINSFEGGAITTQDDELARRVRLMLNFGISGRDQTELEGTNGKMHEGSAAMGLTSLDAMDEIIHSNQRNAMTYHEHLQGIEGIDLVHADPTDRTNDQYMIARVRTGKASLTRDDLMRVLTAENALVRRYFYPGCHRLKPYSDVPKSTPLPLPHTESLADEVLALPAGTAISMAEIVSLCHLIRFALEHGQDIETRLA